MRFLNKINVLTLFIAVSIFGMNCSDDATSSGDSAMISGRVEQSNAKAVSSEATMVYAAEVDANGSFKTIDGTETTTEANGSFTISFDAEPYQHVVVRVVANGETMYGFVNGEVENGGEYTIKPVDMESSAETKVFAKLVSDGSSDMISKAEIDAVITTENSSEVNSSSSQAATVASSLSASAKARMKYFETQFSSEADAKIEAYNNAMMDAQSELETRIDASASATARAEAYDSFYASLSDAYLQAGVESSSAAKAAEMSTRAFINSNTSVGSATNSEANIYIAWISASTIDAAVQAELETAGASKTTTDAVVSAGVDLMTSLEASNGTEANIRAAFDVYHDDVREAMENDANFSATAIVNVDTEINESSGAKATFDAAISSTLLADAMVDIYNSFFTSIESSVETGFDGSQSEVEALTQIMILINTANYVLI